MIILWVATKLVNISLGHLNLFLDFRSHRLFSLFVSDAVKSWVMNSIRVMRFCIKTFIEIFSECHGNVQIPFFPEGQDL